MNKKLEQYLKENYIEKETKQLLFGKVTRAKANYMEETLDIEYVGASNVDDFINNNLDDNNFRNLLFKYIDNKNLKDSDVYNKVNLDRRLFSKIRCNNNYKPSKDTVILLSLSLELSIDELDKLLNSANYSLSNNSISDLIIKFCFLNNIYNINTINEYLYNHKCKTLN
ncbi:MAG: hypothetical protein VZS44_00820 [Bacilli bacterium]|nr:hypothetical protein [Bacilli bacterium]